MAYGLLNANPPDIFLTCSKSRDALNSTHVALIPYDIDDRQFDQHFSLTPWQTWGAAPKNRPSQKEQPQFYDSIA